MNLNFAQKWITCWRRESLPAWVTELQYLSRNVISNKWYCNLFIIPERVWKASCWLLSMLKLVLSCSGLCTSAGHCPELTASRRLSTRRKVRRDAERRTVIFTRSGRSHFCFTGRSSYSSTRVSLVEFTYPQGELPRISHCDCIPLLSQRMKFGAEIAECIEDWRKVRSMDQTSISFWYDDCETCVDMKSPSILQTNTTQHNTPY